MWGFLGNGSTVLEPETLKGNLMDVAPYLRLNDQTWDIELPIVVEQKRSETKDISVVGHERFEKKDVIVESLPPIPVAVE